MMEPHVVSESSMVEGIGDEVVYSVVSVVSIFLASAYMFSHFYRNQWSRGIHPESAASVELTRERLAAQTVGARQPPRVSRSPSDDQTCPICLAEARFGIETNCGHLFCGQCIVTYWRHGTWLGAVRCPVCRQQVTILLFNFNQEENSTASREKDEIVSQIHSYNRRFSGEPRPLLDYIRDLPALLRHAVTEFFSMGGLIWMFRMRVIICFIAALLYFVSPLDIIPEAAFGILGFLDDLFIFLLLAIYVSIIYRQVMESRARAAPQ
ncbi:E3 ubiquitin-protein ligase RNF170-like [Liolophura sinensis]|uniref:E3 ubiquitin-protein ligase RNF170-like n=1 Tax=Liolophura sinensis TaxID=3198878 RepID=UPI00315926E9